MCVLLAIEQPSNINKLTIQQFLMLIAFLFFGCQFIYGSNQDKTQYNIKVIEG